MARAYIGLGANLGDRAATLTRAIELLAERPEIDVVAVSSFRETDPVGYLDQPRFLNAAVAVETSLAPSALLATLLEVERELGRVREGPRYGPRTVDLDLLLMDDLVLDEPGLELPHPRLHERAFALEPLAELDPALVVPGHGAGAAAPPLTTIISMSHLDELDEFEAKLELELKREYTAVFGLFRYCILTQDATYLCNRLDLKVAPQASYPFFHLQMEDVWVWDKNRPTRMIPRAEVYTSGDLTVEELRGEGDEPKLTAQALADRIGEPLPDDGDTAAVRDGRPARRGRPRPYNLLMLLAVDVGNTQTVLGLYDGQRLTEDWRVATERTRTGDELGVLLGGMLDLDAVDGICLASTVPMLIREWERLALRWADAPILVVGPGVRTGIPIRYDDPREVGPDRIVNSVAAKERYGAPVIVVDFGTSTNFDVVSAAGEYVGGVLAPGIETSMEALFARAARLVKVDYVEPPSVIGKTTVGGLQSGVVYGFAGQVDGIVTAIRGELGVEAKVVATGGLSELVAPHSSTISVVDPNLTLDGLRLVWDLNA